MKRGGYGQLGLLALTAVGIAGAVWFGFSSEKTGVKDPGKEEASSSAAVEDDGWRIYCTGRKPPNKKLLNKAKKVPELDTSRISLLKSAMFFALRLRDSETPRRDELSCQTDKLTINFIKNKFDKWAQSNRPFIIFTMKTVINKSTVKVRINPAYGDFDEIDQKNELKKIIKYCTIEKFPDDYGIYYYYKNDVKCVADVNTPDSPRFGYSVMDKSGELVKFMCSSSCSITTNYQNRIITIIFNKNYLEMWQEIRNKSLQFLESRLVLNYDEENCIGELCDALNEGAK